MKKFRVINAIILLGIILIGLNSCSVQGHVQKSPGIDLGNYKTFSWLPPSAEENTAKAQHYQRSYLRSSISEALTKKGLTEVKDNADISIDYDVQVSREERTNSQPVYSRPFVGYRYNRFTGAINRVYYPSTYLGSEYYRVPYKLGNITVNIVDNKTNELAWQGWAETEVDRKRLSNSEMDGIVKAIFKKYRN